MSLALRLKSVLIHSVNLCLVLSLVPRGPGHDNTTYESRDPSLPPDSKQIRWANAAFNYMNQLDCRKVYFTTERECRRLLRIPREQTGVYLADPSPYGRLVAVLPDGSLAREGGHDAVLVVDPYPRANFGHLVLVFYLQLAAEQDSCHLAGGIYLEEGHECLVLAMKRRCRNMLEKRHKRRNVARRCEINFLPLVFLDFEDEQRVQQLTCRGNIPGFSPCPKLRPQNETSGIICDRMRDNTRRCETTHETIQKSKACRVFEICDHAILLSGGWNRWSSRAYHQQNIWDFYYMLRSHGFPKRNIKVFYANGHETGIPVDGETPHDVYPATLKLALRYHIQRLCDSPHCVDSLVLYLNSPSKTDGTSLLWDADQDGEMSPDEFYSIEELLFDLSKCEARQVSLVVDQSFSGEIGRAVRKSKEHRNIAVYASSKDHEYSYEDIFTRHWAHTNHTQKCMKEVFREIKRTMQNSTADITKGENTADVNIFGAPCDVEPPFTFYELRQNYLGCQNLPTALWIQKYINTQYVPDEFQSMGESPAVSENNHGEITRLKQRNRR